MDKYQLRTLAQTISNIKRISANFYLTRTNPHKIPIASFPSGPIPRHSISARPVFSDVVEEPVFMS